MERLLALMGGRGTGTTTPAERSAGGGSGPSRCRQPWGMAERSGASPAARGALRAGFELERRKDDASVSLPATGSTD
jgi:hypothetical protein